jgi:hypothetical protein
LCGFLHSPAKIFAHLIIEHNVQSFEADEEIRFNWILPNRSEESFLFVCLTLNHSKFILEHCFDPISDKVAFMIRAIDVLPNEYFTVSLIDRESEEATLTFRAKTNSFRDYGIISEFST